MGANGQELDLSGVSDDSPLVRLMETKSRVKILDVLLRHSYAPLTEDDIAEHSGVVQSTVNRNISVFEDLGLVEQVSEWPARYQLVKDNPVVEGFERAQLHLLGHSSRLKESDVRQADEEGSWAMVNEPTPDQIRDLVERNPHLVRQYFHEVHGMETGQREGVGAITAA